MIQLQRIAFDHAQLAREGLTQFRQRWKAAAVHLDRRDARTGAQQGAGQTARAGADFEHLPARQIAGDRGDAVEQLLVEQEVLPQRLGCAEAVTRDDVAKGREVGQLPPPLMLSLSKHRRPACPIARPSTSSG